MLPQEIAMLEKAEADMKAMQSSNQNLQSQAQQRSMIDQEQEKNMLSEQLDLTDETEMIEHLLKGEVTKQDEQGNDYWADAGDDDFKPLNEHGVRVIMKMVRFYLNKNKLLSNYSEEQINQKMEDFALELADTIFMKYREMGLDTPEKRKMYSVIVREVQDTVHDTYLRAYGGQERRSLRQHMHISENVGNSLNLQQQQGGSKLNPLNWLRR